MSDPLNDPRFPDRPSHPDFWRISEIVLQNDGEAVEGDPTMESLIKGAVDLDSLSYFAYQRATLSCQRTGLPESVAPVLGSLWMDAFLAGVRFQQRGGHQ